MKNVRWDEVTSFSKWATLIFFTGVLPPITFYIGTQYQEVISQLSHPPVVYPDFGVLCSKIQAQKDAALEFKAAQAAKAATPAAHSK